MNQEIVKTEYRTLALLPAGQYQGIWCGYEIKVKVPGKDGAYILSTKTGVRGIVKVYVTAKEDGTTDIEIHAQC